MRQTKLVLFLCPPYEYLNTTYLPIFIRKYEWTYSPIINIYLWRTKLCTENDIGGYPTLKYWINGDEHDYDGGRSFDDLSTFVSGELAPKCTFAKVENCSEKGKGYIAKWEKKTVDEKEKEIERLSSILAKGSMKADLKKWVHERKRILKSGIGSDEL